MQGRLHIDAFPELKDKLNEDALARLFYPKKIDYYFKDENRTYEIEWEDKSKKIVKLTMTFWAYLIFSKNCSKITWSTSFIDLADRKSQIIALKYGETDLLHLLESVTEQDEDTDNEEWTLWRTKEHFDVVGEKKIQYEYITYLNLSSDNIISYEAGRYGDGFTLHYVYPKDMQIIFSPTGLSTTDFPPNGKKCPGYGNRKVRSSDGLLLVGQGFLLRIHEQQ